MWEEKHPKVAQALWDLMAAHSQQDPTFRTSVSDTRLTAAKALEELRIQGFQEDKLPSPSNMAEILNRNGYRLRKVLKAKPLKKIPQTDAIFDNIQKKDGKPLTDETETSEKNGRVKRLSIDCKATVNIGDYSRGGVTRGNTHALDHVWVVKKNSRRLVETMLEWAKTMTWKGIKPVVNLSRTIYQKGVSVSKYLMVDVEARLKRNPILPKWDILIPLV